LEPSDEKQGFSIDFSGNALEWGKRYEERAICVVLTTTTYLKNPVMKAVSRRAINGRQELVISVICLHLAIMEP
jgi:hypothetical protein